MTEKSSYGFADEKNTVFQALDYYYFCCHEGLIMVKCCKLSVNRKCTSHNSISKKIESSANGKKKE